MVRILLTLIICFSINYSCSVKKQTCETNLDKIFLNEKPKNLKIKGTAYIKSTPVLFLFKQSKLKIFTPFGKKIGEFDKNLITKELSFIKELPITLEEILTAKIYKNNISKISCENGYTVLRKSNINFYIKNSKIKYIKWKNYKIEYSYNFSKVSIIKLYNKDKVLLKIYLK